MPYSFMHFPQVARTAKLMVTSMGMSKKMGQVAWSSGGGPSFLGSSMGQPPDCSGQTSDEIDLEVKQLVDRAYR
jgi:cell division protease FtsH